MNPVIRVLALSFALLAAAGCGGAREPAADVPAQGRASSACPGADFPAFVAAYAADVAVQRRWTRFPLQTVRNEDADPEPQPRQRTLSQAEATFPLMPPAAQLRTEGREMRIEQADGEMRVTLEKPDTDWRIDYAFAPADGCWRLVRIEDRSL